ncbi:MAG TPA: CHASE2 domain-containing protein [Methylomirabilota bacterium]|nr:CHASE2 domain-containing protein [Methylomirabilota bacterium]
MFGGRALATLTRYRGGLGAAALAVAVVLLGLIEPTEYFALDQFFELRGARSPVAPIVIVSVDESSFVELNTQWPFPRAMHARLIDLIAAGRPRAIGIDLILDLPSARGERDDAALGEAVARAGNVVLAAAPADEQAGYTSLPFSYSRTTPNLPIDAVRKGAAGVGAINTPLDSDGRLRRMPRRQWTGVEWLPGFDVELHRVVTAAGLPAAPLPAVDPILINFSGPLRTFPWVSYFQVMNGTVEPTFFADKIVLVGPTSDQMHDVFATPFTRGRDQMPGVEIHANALQTYITGQPIREAPVWVSTVVAVAAALLAAALVVRLHPLRALAAVSLLWVIVTLFAYLVFVSGHAWMRGMAGTLGLVLGYGVTVVDHFVREQRERRRLAQFFSPEVLNEVVRHRREQSLSSSRRMVTVLFADIRGFTALSEKLAPEEVAEMLREYLTETTDVIFKHGGTVDKYIGDCVMALYNAPLQDPDHVLHAMQTALELQERTLKVSARWEQRLGTAIRSGIGINTGEAVVGTMGSRQRLEYTAIGDTINLGSRLEALTKEYGVAIVISEFTRRRLNADFLTRELGEVTVRGRTQPVKIYGVLPADLRKHPRAVIDVSATLTLSGAGESHPVATRDVSEGGMALAGVPEAWAVGTRVEVRCEGGQLPGPLAADAIVAWRRGDEAGITFVALDPESGPIVADYLSRRRSR